MMTPVNRSRFGHTKGHTKGCDQKKPRKQVEDHLEIFNLGNVFTLNPLLGINPENQKVFSLYQNVQLFNHFNHFLGRHPFAEGSQSLTKRAIIKRIIIKRTIKQVNYRQTNYLSELLKAIV